MKLDDKYVREIVKSSLLKGYTVVFEEDSRGSYLRMLTSVKEGVVTIINGYEPFLGELRELVAKHDDQILHKIPTAKYMGLFAPSKYFELMQKELDDREAYVEEYGRAMGELKSKRISIPDIVNIDIYSQLAFMRDDILSLSNNLIDIEESMSKRTYSGAEIVATINKIKGGTSAKAVSEKSDVWLKEILKVVRGPEEEINGSLVPWVFSERFRVIANKVSLLDTSVGEISPLVTFETLQSALFDYISVLSEKIMVLEDDSLQLVNKIPVRPYRSIVRE